MSRLIQDIRDQKEGIVTNTSSLVIEQTLQKLFYAPPDMEEELKMLRMQMEQKHGDRYGLHASAIIASDNDFCYREQVLSLFYKQAQGSQVAVGLKRIFEEGNYIHEKWQRLFIRGKLGVAKCMDRSRFVDEYDLSFTPDALIKIGKKKYVVEIKSVNTFQFKNMKSHPSGRKQLQLYMQLVGIHQGFVLAEDKNTQEFKIFYEELQEAVTAPFIKTLDNIQKFKESFLKRKVMADGICQNASCKRALKCNMRDACWKVGMGRVKLCTK